MSELIFFGRHSAFFKMCSVLLLLRFLTQRISRVTVPTNQVIQCLVTRKGQELPLLLLLLLLTVVPMLYNNIIQEAAVSFLCHRSGRLWLVVIQFICCTQKLGHSRLNSKYIAGILGVASQTPSLSPHDPPTIRLEIKFQFICWMVTWLVGWFELTIGTDTN